MKNFKGLLPLMMMYSGMFGMLSEPDELKSIDIEKEYELIQKKKSHLSRRLREIVIYRYEQLKERGDN